MARTMNEQEHAMKQNEILDAFQRLVVTQGYEQRSASYERRDLEV